METFNVHRITRVNCEVVSNDIILGYYFQRSKKQVLSDILNGIKKNTDVNETQPMTWNKNTIRFYEGNEEINLVWAKNYTSPKYSVFKFINAIDQMQTVNK